MDNDIYTASGQGQISQGIDANLLVKKIEEFVLNELPNWRNDPNRSSHDSENILNSELCDFLAVQARHKLAMVRFKHQPADETKPRRHLDFAAQPDFTAEGYSIYRPIVVFEGKRLPAPSKKRQHEYVTGLTEISGGIQRF